MQLCKHWWHQGYSPNGGPFSDHWKDRLGTYSYVNMTVEMLHCVGSACVSSCVITVAVATSYLLSAGFSLPMMRIVGWVWARVSFCGCSVPMVTLVLSTYPALPSVMLIYWYILPSPYKWHCLTSACCDHLHSQSFSHQCCSLTVALYSHSICNLWHSVTLNYTGIPWLVICELCI